MKKEYIILVVAGILLIYWLNKKPKENKVQQPKPMGNQVNYDEPISGNLEYILSQQGKNLDGTCKDGYQQIQMNCIAPPCSAICVKQ